MSVTSRARAFARSHPVASAAVVSLTALTVVFAAALEVVPSGMLPRAPEAALAAIPHINAVVSVAAIGTITAGVLFARNGHYDRHRQAMLASLGLFAVFLALYLYRVALKGPTPFPGPDSVYATVYLPILVVHVTLAIVCIPLLAYTAVLGLSHSIGRLKQTRHGTIGKVAATLWVISFTLGSLVYLLLYVVY